MAAVAAPLLIWAATASSVVALAQENGFAFRAGIERSTGNYGASQDLDDTYVPLTLLYDAERVSFRLTVPYLEIELADTLSADPSATYTESGLGDAIVGLTVYDVLRSSDGRTAVDFTGKVKLPTADEQQALGTGETDYTGQADVYRFLNRGLLVATLGYKLRGEPAGVVLDNSWFAGFGGLYRLNAKTNAGIFADYRESSIPGSDSIREVTLQLTRQLDGGSRVQIYLVRGLSDTTLDWGAGLSIRRQL